MCGIRGQTSRRHVTNSAYVPLGRLPRLPLPHLLSRPPPPLPPPPPTPSPPSTPSDFKGIYSECAAVLYQEIDYLNEGRNADRFRWGAEAGV